jgi:hypothetical protein
MAVAVPGLPGPPGVGTISEYVALNGTAAVALGGQRAVYRRADGLIDYASNDNPAHMNVPIWVTTGAVVGGATVTMVTVGEIEEPSWSWTAGPIFLGVNGVLTQTLPAEPTNDFLAIVGTASTPTRMYVNRQPSIDLI